MECKTCKQPHNGSFGSGQFCSRSCANTRQHTAKTKAKIKKANAHKKLTVHYKQCETCEQSFGVTCKTYRKKHCSNQCRKLSWSKKGSVNGRKSAQARRDTARSKNEMLFAELCRKYFGCVITNEPMFNGWDADVIIEDIKVAVLWNGRWHYEQITRTHSVEQVQNRDKIKIKEIKRAGYRPVVIKDMGGYDPRFVQEKFNEFIGGECELAEQIAS